MVPQEVRRRARQASAEHRCRHLPGDRLRRQVRGLRRRPPRGGPAHHAAADRRSRHARHRRRLHGYQHRYRAEEDRRHELQDPRRRSRFRRHLVLEPLPGRALRHRVVHLPAVPRGDGLRPHRAVHPRQRDLRLHTVPLQAVRPVRERPLPDPGHRDGMGRGHCPVDGAHRRRRRLPCPLRLHPERPVQPPPAARHPRDREVRRPQLPHQPVGLRLHRR